MAIRYAPAPEKPKQKHERRGRPKLDQPKEQVTLRIDADVLERYRQTGKGWQSRLNDDLRRLKRI